MNRATIALGGVDVALAGFEPLEQEDRFPSCRSGCLSKEAKRAEGDTMKRLEAKFVHASPRLAPDQLKVAPHTHETRARWTARRAPQTELAAAPVRRGKASVK